MRAAPEIKQRRKAWAAKLSTYRNRLSEVRDMSVEGVLNRMVGMTLEAVGCEAAVGGRCLIHTHEGRRIEAEVVGFSGEKLYLMPTSHVRGLMPGARVVPT